VLAALWRGKSREANSAAATREHQLLHHLEGHPHIHLKILIAAISTMNEYRRLLMLVSVVAVLGLLVGCAYVGIGRNENARQNPYARYYTGTRGVEAQFMNVPTLMYYYGPSDPNTFTLGVDVHNRGASFTRGGIYLSGFDPNLVHFKEIPIARGGLNACGVSIGSIGFGQLGGIFRCDGVEVSGGQGITNIKIDSLNNLIAGIGSRFGKTTWWDPSKFDLSLDLQQNPSGTNFMVNFRDPQIKAEYFQHGRLFIAFLAGIDFIKFGGQEFLLAGNTYDFPGGESSYIQYTGAITDWPPGLDLTRQNLLLTSCYQYTTYADPIVCIDPEPQSDNRKVCYPKSVTWNGGNGAPVAVTSIEQENTPRKIIFRINVKNVGTGTVYDAGQLEKCSPYYPSRVTPADLNVVYLGDVRVGTRGLAGRGGTGGIVCYPDVIRLDPTTKTGTTTCTYPVEFANLKSAYETPLVVELWYGYSQTVQRQIQIKRVI